MESPPPSSPPTLPETPHLLLPCALPQGKSSFFSFAQVQAGSELSDDLLKNATLYLNKVFPQILCVKSVCLSSSLIPGNIANWLQERKAATVCRNFPWNLMLHLPQTHAKMAHFRPTLFHFDVDASNIWPKPASFNVMFAPHKFGLD